MLSGLSLKFPLFYGKSDLEKFLMHEMKYRRTATAFILFTVSILTTANSVAADSWIKKTIDLTINTSFDEALHTIREQIKKDSTDYRAWFYLAATYNSRMTHFENQADLTAFDQAIERTVSLVENELDNGTDIPDSVKAQLFFYLGSAYGYRAYVQGRAGQFIGAVSNGIKSIGYLNDSLEKDSTLYGAYLGIGVYKYWRYSRLGFISWLPVIPDDREQGIAMIKVAVANDSLSRYMAMHQLIYILLDYGKTTEALKYARLVVQKYPESQFMWWANAHAYYKQGDLRQAENSYRHLYRLIKDDKHKNINHLLKCQYRRAEIARQLNEYDQCIDYCETILNYSQKSDLNDDAREILSEAEDMRIECSRLITARPGTE